MYAVLVNLKTMSYRKVWAELGFFQASCYLVYHHIRGQIKNCCCSDDTFSSVK